METRVRLILTIERCKTTASKQRPGLVVTRTAVSIQRSSTPSKTWTELRVASSWPTRPASSSRISARAGPISREERQLRRCRRRQQTSLLTTEFMLMCDNRSKIRFNYPGESSYQASLIQVIWAGATQLRMAQLTPTLATWQETGCPTPSAAITTVGFTSVLPVCSPGKHSISTSKAWHSKASSTRWA